MPNRDRHGKDDQQTGAGLVGDAREERPLEQQQAYPAYDGERAHVRVPEDLQPLLTGVSSEQPVAGVEEPLRVYRSRQQQQRRDEKRPDDLRRQDLPRPEVQ